MKSRWRGGRGFDPHQFQINWNGADTVQTDQPAASPPVATPRPESVAHPQVLRLKWDFRNTFPQPTEQAIEAGTVSAEDVYPDAIRAIHEEHAREMLATLHDLDAVLDAKRHGVDPRNMKTPRLGEAKARLTKFFETEPPRLEAWFENLLGVYEDAFGEAAAEAFGKAVRAWHAGIEVVAQPTPAIQNLSGTAEVSATPNSTPAKSKRPRMPRRDRPTARMPVPRPLPASITAGHFGYEEDGKPVHPGSREVREITEQHADHLVELLDQLGSAPSDAREGLQAKFAAGIAAYEQDFGSRASRQLEAYVRRQAGLDARSRNGR